MKIKLYLDMDGVICNFDKAFREISGSPDDRVRFKTAINDYKIFRHLEYMPDAEELLTHVRSIVDVDIEILTSMGTFDPFLGKEVKRQKTNWLAERNINYPRNFVRSKVEKSKYATETSILIDDSIGCIDPFVAKGGEGILHKSTAETIPLLDSTILRLRALDALRLQ